MVLPSLGIRGKPRAARRSRKPLQEKWPKAPRGKWLKCMYAKCGHEWQYFGERKWAECPTCHTVAKVAVAARNFRTWRIAA